MYGDVNVAVEDGNLGRSSSTGSGVQFKVDLDGMAMGGIKINDLDA